MDAQTAVPVAKYKMMLFFMVPIGLKDTRSKWNSVDTQLEDEPSRQNGGLDESDSDL